MIQSLRPLVFLSVSAVLSFTSSITTAGEHAIEVGHGSFRPSSLTVKQGDSVTFTNTAMMPGGHTVVAVEGDVGSSGLSKGQSWSYTFESSGTYRFQVQEHPGNTATIVVE